MAAIVRVTPLGFGTLLELDDFTFLLDCGWSESFTEESSLHESLRRAIARADAVLLSHPDLSHLGALPFASGRLGLAAPVYATLPVYQMGLITMYDTYLHRRGEEAFEAFDLDNVDSAFDKIEQLKYSQTVRLTGKGAGISFTPYAAGHTIGGAVWKITKETEEIVYAVAYNHHNERHLNRTVLQARQLQRPTLLITDSFSAGMPKPKTRTERDTDLTRTITRTLRGGGSVLMPTDAAARVLELLLVLDKYWSEHPELHGYPLVLLNNVADHVTKYAKGQLEWMNAAISKNFHATRMNPFDFKHLKQCHTLEEVDQLPEPRVVLASPTGMDCGQSRRLFVRMAGSQKNAVILTDRGEQGTLTRQLVDEPLIPGSIRTLEMKSRVELTGAELQRHEHEEALRKAEMARRDTLLAVESESDESDDEDNARRKEDTVVQGCGGGGGSGEAVTDLDPGSAYFRRGYDEIVRVSILPNGPALAAGCPVFPSPEPRWRTDHWGELINPEAYRRIETVAVPVRSSAVEGANEPLVEERPKRDVVERLQLEVLCSITYIVFEGRSDGPSIRRVLRDVQPRKLILVDGQDIAATENLRAFCAKEITEHTWAPRIGQCVDMTSDGSVYKVRLDDALIDGLRMAKVGDYELAFLDGVLSLPDAAEEDVDGADLLPVLKTKKRKTQDTHTSVMIGDVKLSHFKQLLVQQGFQAEFAGGLLVVGGVVTLHRQENGEIAVEGSLCDEYYRVRELLYSLHCIL